MIDSTSWSDDRKDLVLRTASEVIEAIAALGDKQQQDYWDLHLAITKVLVPAFEKGSAP
jgi:hypothetical protein